MAAQGRIKTKYVGVYFTERKNRLGKMVKRFSVTFRVGGKVYEESARVLIDDGPDTRPAETPQEASAWRARRIIEVSTPVEERTVPFFDEIWAKWISGMAGRSSLQAAQSRYRVHIKPMLGDKPASEICSFDMERFRRDLEEKGLAPGSVKGVLALVSQVLRWAADHDLIQPMNLKIRYPKLDNEKTESMTMEQLAAYWQALDEEPDQHVADFFRVMILTGVRKTALSLVEWPDVDLERGFLLLRGETAKNGKTQSVPLPMRAVEIFKAMTRTDSPLVWPGRNGKPMSHPERIGRRPRDRAGLPKDFRPCHGLRHTFASHLASSGKVDLYTLQRLLTHSSSDMTQRYAHLSSEALARAASVADEVLAPGQDKVIAINGKAQG
ncbi:MAG: site-specific integrase [Deltaproteobacteria bacterium]|nr:site-specific integrase [Deltaproteobacteria bacterium]